MDIDTEPTTFTSIGVLATRVIDGLLLAHEEQDTRLAAANRRCRDAAPLDGMKDGAALIMDSGPVKLPAGGSRTGAKFVPVNDGRNGRALKGSGLLERAPARLRTVREYTVRTGCEVEQFGHRTLEVIFGSREQCVGHHANDAGSGCEDGDG